MKKILLMLALVLCFNSFAYAQAPEKVLSEKSIVWFGLDFSKIKLINSDADPDKVINRFFKSWNNLIIKEQKKYNIKKAFRKNSMKVDLETVKKRNKLPDPDALIVYDEYKLKEADIKAVIKKYGSSHEKGMGLVFIMESFDKEEEEGCMWITFFDIATKNVLFTQRMCGESGGIGFRNYWARTIYNVLKEAENNFE